MAMRYHGDVRPLRDRLALVLVLSCACTDDGAADDSGAQCLGEPAPFPNGELIHWFGFGHDFGEFCSAGYEISEDHARWVAEAWGTEPAAFGYGLFESSDDPCWPCSEGSLGCVKPNIATTWVPHRHEIAHAVRPGRCFSLIEEGYASLYGDHFMGRTTEGDIRIALAEAGKTRLPEQHYPIATRFVAFLLETRGIDKLRELCDLPADDAAQFEQTIMQTYGVSFEDIATEFDSYPEWSELELRQDQACESTDILVQPTEWDFHFACGEPGIEGKLGREFDAQRLVELPQEGMYEFVFESDQDLQLEIELRNCTRDGMASIFYAYDVVHVVAGSPEGLLLIKLYPAGLYAVRVRVDEPAGPVDLHVSVKPWP